MLLITELICIGYTLGICVGLLMDIRYLKKEAKERC